MTGTGSSREPRRKPRLDTVRDPLGDPFRAPVAALRRLGAMPVTQFLRTHWQRRPLLLRQALAAALPAIGFERLRALAARDDVESRLVIGSATPGQRWQLRHGPFATRALPSRRRPGWTLLVQGVDRIDSAMARLLAQFRFLPDARLDDVMVSFATDRGGVGPHVDSYDVFLLQASGRRRWRIATRPVGDAAPLQSGQPLKILARFAPDAEWILEPGDLLYLPPGIAHEGTALGESITCSVGLRSPAWQELVEPWYAALADATQLAGRYRDAGLRATARPARLPAALLGAAYRQLAARRPSSAAAAKMLLEWLTEPPRLTVFDAAARHLSAARFAATLARRDLLADLRTRMMYSGRWFAINGQSFDADPASRGCLQRFADLRVLPAGSIAPAAPLAARLRLWYLAGWIHLNDLPSAVRRERRG